MGNLVIGTPKELWRGLILDAKEAHKKSLSEFLTDYLAFVLAECGADSCFYDEALVLNLLKAPLCTTKSETCGLLRKVGKESLILLGLFPSHLRKRGLPESYFIRMGRSAYFELSLLTKSDTSRMYTEIVSGFISMVEILRAIKEIGKKEQICPHEQAGATQLSKKIPLMLIRGDGSKKLLI